MRRSAWSARSRNNGEAMGEQVRSAERPSERSEWLDRLVGPACSTCVARDRLCTQGALTGKTFITHPVNSFQALLNPC